MDRSSVFDPARPQRAGGRWNPAAAEPNFLTRGERFEPVRNTRVPTRSATALRAPLDGKGLRDAAGATPHATVRAADWCGRYAS